MTTESNDWLPPGSLDLNTQCSLSYDEGVRAAPFGFCRYEGCKRAASVDVVGHFDKCPQHHSVSTTVWNTLSYTQRTNLLIDFYQTVERLPLSVAIYCAERNMSRRNFRPTQVVQGWRSLCPLCMNNRPEDGPYGRAHVGVCPHTQPADRPENIVVPELVAADFSLPGVVQQAIPTPSLLEVREFVADSEIHRLLNECLDL